MTENVKPVEELKVPASGADPMVPFSQNYKRYISSGSQYGYQPINPDFPTFNLSSSTGQQTTIFRIQGANVYNLARSRFRFNVAISSPGAVFVKHRVDLPLIDAIQVEVDGVSQKFLDISNFPVYWQQTRCAYPDEKFNTHNPIAFGQTLALARPRMGVCRYDNPSNASLGTAMAGVDTAGGVPGNNCRVITHGSVLADRIGSFHDTSKQIAVSSVSGQGIAYVAELSGDQFVDTILAMDKNVKIPGGLTITITWGYSGRVWQGSAAAAIETGSADYGGTIAISGLALDLCKEYNSGLLKDLEDQLATTGLSIAYPVSRVVLQSLSGAGEFSPKVTNSAGEMQNLLRIYCCELVNGSRHQSYNMNNVDGAKATQVRHSVNGNNIDQQDLKTQELRDYLASEHLFSGSANNYSAAEYYQYAPVYVANFANIKKLSDAATMNFVADGMPVINNVEFSRTVTVTGAMFTAFTVVGQRELFITPTSASSNAGKAISANPAA